MVDGIQGRSGALAREATLAALKEHARAAEAVRDLARETAPEAAALGAGAAPASGPAGVQSTGAPDFADALKSTITEVNAEVQRADVLPEELVSGEVGNLAEVATRLKTAELSFRFSMEIRNKLIDAYREVMRMQV